MYDTNVALRRFRNLIKWTATRYGVPGDPSRDREELEAEGYLVLVKCCNDFPTGHQRFARYFKTCWYHRIYELHRFNGRNRRKGIPVELKDIHAIPAISDRSYPIELTQYKRHLSPESFRILTLLANPTQEVYDAAWTDYCRKHKMVVIGLRSRMPASFRVMTRHFCQVLKVTRSQILLALSELGKIVKSQSKRRVLNHEIQIRKDGVQIQEDEARG